MPEMELYILLPILVALCLITFFLGWYIQVRINKSKVDGAENVAKKILKDAETKSTELVSEAEKRAKNFRIEAEKSAHNLKKEKLLEVKDEFYKRKQKYDEEVRSREKEIGEIEKRIKAEKETAEKIKNDLITKEKNAQQAHAEYTAKLKEFTEKKNQVD